MTHMSGGYTISRGLPFGDDFLGRDRQPHHYNANPQKAHKRKKFVQKRPFKPPGTSFQPFSTFGLAVATKRSFNRHANYVSKKPSSKRVPDVENKSSHLSNEESQNPHGGRYEVFESILEIAGAILVVGSIFRLGDIFGKARRPRR